MSPKRAAALFFLSIVLAASGFAQSAATTSEFGRSSAGELDLITKHPQRLSGSFDLGFGSGRFLGAALGGTLVKDRVWFFASAERTDPGFALGKVNANLGERQNFTASSSKFSMPVPSSFLSMHYTGIVSNNMFFTVTASRSAVSSEGSQPILVLH